VPRAVSSAITARKVRSGYSAIRANRQSRSPASRSGRHPPIWAAAALPVARNRCGHFTTLATLTPKQRRHRPAGVAPRHRANHPIAQILRIGSCHSMLDPNPSQHLQSQNQAPVTVFLIQTLRIML